MLKRERYWSRKGMSIPETTDLPSGTFKGNENTWCSLSPGMRRTIWRDAIYREMLKRQLSDDMISKIRSATIEGDFGTLDEYINKLGNNGALTSPISSPILP